MPVKIHKDNRPKSPFSEEFAAQSSRIKQTELSINDIYALAWNASQGSSKAREELTKWHAIFANRANARMRALEKAETELSAYNRAYTYLENIGKTRFSKTLPKGYKAIREEMVELLSFLNAKSSTVANARKILTVKLDKISEYTGKEYTQEQRKVLGKLLGDDSISALLREVRGDSGEVLDFLEDVANDSNINIDQISSIIDRHLSGYTPFSNVPFADNFGYLTYDELMDTLSEEYGWERD